MSTSFKWMIRSPSVVWGHDELGVGSSFSVYSSTLEQGKFISIDKSGEITLPLIGKVNWRA